MKELFCIGGVAAMAQLVLCFDPFGFTNAADSVFQYNWNQADKDPSCYMLDDNEYLYSETETLWHPLSETLWYENDSE